MNSMVTDDLKMNRRSFIDNYITRGFVWLSFGLLSGCGYEESPKRNKLRRVESLNEKEGPPSEPGDRKSDDSLPVKSPSNDDTPNDLKPTPPVENEPLPEPEYVEFFPLYAMATYFDGSLGPVTAEITSVNMTSEQDEELVFWHGHGGRSHKFVLSKLNKIQILEGNKVVIETSTVDGHAHKLFIDPTDKQWRIAGAEMVRIPKWKEMKS